MVRYAVRFGLLLSLIPAVAAPSSADKICPKGKEHYPDSAVYCRRHGKKLVPASKRPASASHSNGSPERGKVPSEVTLKINTRPTGALVIVDDKEEGQTNFARKYRLAGEGTKRLNVLITLDGYRPEPLDITLDSSSATLVYEVKLQPEGEGNSAHTASGADTRADSNATGLVIDIGTLKIERAQSPRIVEEDGTVVYPEPGHEPDPEMTQDKGVLAYCVAEVETRKRCGEQPLVIKALRLLENRAWDIVISKEDAERIRTANGRKRFLRRCDVCVLSTKPEVASSIPEQK